MIVLLSIIHIIAFNKIYDHWFKNSEYNKQVKIKLHLIVYYYFYFFSLIGIKFIITNNKSNKQYNTNITQKIIVFVFTVQIAWMMCYVHIATCGIHACDILTYTIKKKTLF